MKLQELRIGFSLTLLYYFSCVCLFSAVDFVHMRAGVCITFPEAYKIP